MLHSTLCYIICGQEWLLLYRNKKKDDVNEGKWIGIGGKLKEGETLEECNRREVFEETGIRLSRAVSHGTVHFRSDSWQEDMHLFSAQLAEKPRLIACSEGTLAWIPKDKIKDLPLWEGDRYFLSEMTAGRTDIDMTLLYEGDTLVSVSNKGR
ncbi:MAG: 8-oxo-dGTP diphosphatase [Firmicutes bacterium]|nr:8-oxo-dGTP diphosphatase [Bacillota bacterium]